MECNDWGDLGIVLTVSVMRSMLWWWVEVVIMFVLRLWLCELTEGFIWTKSFDWMGLEFGEWLECYSLIFLFPSFFPFPLFFLNLNVSKKKNFERFDTMKLPCRGLHIATPTLLKQIVWLPLDTHWFNCDITLPPLDYLPWMFKNKPNKALGKSSPHLETGNQKTRNFTSGKDDFQARSCEQRRKGKGTEQWSKAKP